MTTTTDTTDVYAEQFFKWARILGRDCPAWLHPVRQAALAQFAERGFPTMRDEDWRHTNVAPVASTEFVPAQAHAAKVTPEQIQQFRLRGDDEAVMVFVNGYFAGHLSDVTTLPEGVRGMNLAEALAVDLPVVKEHFARLVKSQDNAFVALNTAFAQDGAVIDIPPDVVVETPIHLLFVATAEEQPVVAHPRNLIVAGDNSSFRVIEHYVALDQGVYFNNAVTELFTGDNLAGDHCKVIRESDQAYHIATLQMRQGRSNRITSQTICLGGALVRNDINPVLDGEGAESSLDGLYMLDGAQHTDNHLCVEHRSPHTSSRECFRGILDGKSRGVFCGRIIVRPGAQKTDAKQSNMNILLSGQAQIDTKPQLEILADDVKCTHGATIGQIDPDAIFYFRSRGIAEDAARNLLVYAFAREGLSSVQDERLRAQLEEVVLSRLPDGELLRGVV
ncbi:MAG: Fe-S cluster assembly protein SufD [Phycisphaerales bacterium]|nr:MAG: Fe-S cluster assembly protein SufD [Phycisphaerales bacterium]